MSELILRAKPAYGRRYETKEEILKAWEEGRDFKFIVGPYFSIRDCKSLKVSGFTGIDLAGVYIPLQ